LNIGNMLLKEHQKTSSLASEGIAPLLMQSIAKNTGYYFATEDWNHLKKQNIDLIVSLRADLDQKNLHQVSKLGILKIHHGEGLGLSSSNNLIGFYETLNELATSSFNILHQGDCILSTSNFSQVSLSTTFPFRLNSMRLQRKSMFFLHHFIENINESEVDFNQKNLQSILKVSNQSAPSLIDSFKYLIQSIAYLAQSIYMKLMNRHGRWNVGFLQSNDWKNLDLKTIQVIKNQPDQFLADPFLFQKNGSLYCFVEDYYYSSPVGRIRAFLLKDNTPIDLGIVLSEPFHLSYPNIFSVNDEVFMCPETSANNDIRLYKSTNFPHEWRLHKSLIQNVSAADTNIFLYEDRWWLFTNIDSSDIGDHCSELHIFYSDQFDSINWMPHSKNPVISTSQQSRNAGVINSTDGLFRSFQIQDFNFYGKSIGISKILLLTPDDYQEKIIHAIEPTFIKNIKGTHHLSYKYDVAAIDFYRYENIKN